LNDQSPRLENYPESYQGNSAASQLSNLDSTSRPPGTRPTPSPIAPCPRGQFRRKCGRGRTLTRPLPILTLMVDRLLLITSTHLWTTSGYILLSKSSGPYSRPHAYHPAELTIDELLLPPVMPMPTPATRTSPTFLLEPTLSRQMEQGHTPSTIYTDLDTPSSPEMPC
jgi:hypothetical protein